MPTPPPVALPHVYDTEIRRLVNKTVTPSAAENPTAPDMEPLPKPWFADDTGGVRLYHGDALDLLTRMPPESFDVIFADPPYFLSGGGITCQAGRMVSVDKGIWDRPTTFAAVQAFNMEWLGACRNLLKPNGTIWVSGTMHNIYSVGFALQTLGYKILNDIAWHKTNPPPHLACRYFTHAHETLLWARKSPSARHYFNYAEMKADNNNKQMQSVWKIAAPATWEKRHGKHPTQKPEALLDRIIRAASQPGELILDPFSGGGTTGVVAARRGRRFVGIELDEDFLRFAQARLTDELATPSLPLAPNKVDIFTRKNSGGGVMASLSFYQSRYGITSETLAFARFTASLQNYYDATYYVDWTKVYKNVARHRREWLLLSSLCDAPDKETAARELLQDYPQLLPVLPLLMGCRGTRLEIVESAAQARVSVYDFTAPPAGSRLSDADANRYVDFLLRSGLLDLFSRIRFAPDYVTGVEVGMDTNARKNRGGTCGVAALAPFVEQAEAQIPGLRVQSEATYEFLTRQGCLLPPSYKGVRWDWAFWRDNNAAPGNLGARKFVVSEVNHYGGSGSKPPAIAREYMGRQIELDAAGVGFIWVTDGAGWAKMGNPLAEAFAKIQYMVSIGLAADGLLEWALRDLLAVPAPVPSPLLQTVA